MYSKHDGLAVLGFPCNQFAAEEPGSESQIKAFVSIPPVTPSLLLPPLTLSLLLSLLGPEETKIGPDVISAAPIRARTANGTTREAASECFFLIGDYGRENHPKQAAVAQSMDTVARELCQPLAVLTVGDNFQTTGGLNSFLDKEFNESFVYPYRFQVSALFHLFLLRSIDQSRLF